MPHRASFGKQAYWMLVLSEYSDKSHNVTLQTSFTDQFKGLQGVTGGYKELQGVTKGYNGLQKVTGGYGGLQRVTGGYKELQGVTGG